MKKSLLTIILALSVVLTACSEEDINGTETSEADTQDTQEEEKSSNPRSNVTDEEKAEMKRKYEEEKAEKEEQRIAEEEAEKERKEEEAKEKERAKKEEVEKVAAEKKNAEALYLQIMKDSVGAYVSIDFDESSKIYTLTPTDPNLIDEISMLPLGIGHEDWGVLVDGMASMSNSGKDLVGTGYTMNLVNPLNHENVILWIVDGEVIYNVIDDL